MRDFKYKVSVIIPIYNMEKYLEACLDSIVAQTIDKDLIEVLLIDDGSRDGSADIMARYAEQYPFFREIHKENEGPARTRNRGIKEAQGKYIMYLDSDDAITPETIKNVTDFFDDHYDEVDMVSYYEEIFEEDGKVEAHPRHEMLTKTGIYDLSSLEHAFCWQTNMNICVRNHQEDNVLFDISEGYMHEDQKYCTAILLRKMKLGYCAEGIYQYIRNSNSITNTWFYAYYLFEPTMKYWEELFAQFDGDNTPYYIQALYLNDIRWKSMADDLLPYHYSEVELGKAIGRVRALLDKVSDEVILNFPGLDEVQKPFFIQQKSNNDIHVEETDQYVRVINHGKTLFEEERFHVVINRLRLSGGKITIEGHVKSPIFSFIEKPVLLLRTENGKQEESLELRKSSYSYYRSKIETAKVWSFEVTVDINVYSALEFIVCINGKRFRTYCTFARVVPLGVRRTKILRGNVEVRYEEPFLKIRTISGKKAAVHNRRLLMRGIVKNNGVWYIRNRAWLLKNKERIWLYYDCKGVPCDNAFYQFEHDIKKDDGIQRYYVVNENDFSDAVKRYPHEYRKRIVKFGSTRHKILFLACSKVITAYIERKNIHPFDDPKDYKKHLDLFDYPKLYYLQHGVLHAHMPWKYTYDRLCLEKMIISTGFEEENLKAIYGFTDNHLAKTGMPRYDNIDCGKPAVAPRRILFAPTWRDYLVGDAGNEWVTTKEKFMNSVFFKETQALLNSERLEELLEKNNAFLDYKAHPVFERYNDLFEIRNSRVTIAGKKVDESEYSIFITDFSSFVYDFVYLKRPIIYYVPDYTMFKSGMSQYRQIDMPLEDGMGELAKTGEDVITAISKIIENDYRPLSKYEEKMDGFFFHYDNEQRKRVYKEICN